MTLVTRWLAVAFLLLSAYLAWDHFVLARPIERGPGAIAGHAPLQGVVDDATPVLAKEDFRLTPLATFAMEARVIRSERYCCNASARLAPIDVVFGWGRMSDEAVLARIDINQSGRFYYWRYEGLAPISRREIETSSANMHLIAATPMIEKRIQSLRSGNLVTLKGYLVEVNGPGDFRWRSSLTREDTGDGACEVIWVESLEVS